MKSKVRVSYSTHGAGRDFSKADLGFIKTSQVELLLVQKITTLKAKGSDRVFFFQRASCESREGLSFLAETVT